MLAHTSDTGVSSSGNIPKAIHITAINAICIFAGGTNCQITITQTDVNVKWVIHIRIITPHISRNGRFVFRYVSVDFASSVVRGIHHDTPVTECHVQYAWAARSCCAKQYCSAAIGCGIYCGVTGEGKVTCQEQGISIEIAITHGCVGICGINVYILGCHIGVIQPDSPPLKGIAVLGCIIRCATDADISLRCIQSDVPKKYSAFDITNISVNSNITRRTGNSRILNVYKAMRSPDPLGEFTGTVDVDIAGSIQGISIALQLEANTLLAVTCQVDAAIGRSQGI